MKLQPCFLIFIHQFIASYILPSNACIWFCGFLVLSVGSSIKPSYPGKFLTIKFLNCTFFFSRILFFLDATLDTSCSAFNNFCRTPFSNFLLSRCVGLQFSGIGELGELSISATGDQHIWRVLTQQCSEHPPVCVYLFQWELSKCISCVLQKDVLLIYTGSSQVTMIIGSRISIVKATQL